MRILINDEPINFTLENETTLGQVVDQLGGWLAGERLAISSLSVDSSELPLYAPESWRSRSIDDIETIHVTASTYREMKLSAFQTMLQYLVLLKNGVENRKDAQLKDLLSQYPFVQDSLNLLVDVKNDSGASSTLDKIIESSGILEGAIKDEASRELLIQHVKDLEVILMNRMREVTQPRTEAASTAMLLQQSVPEISEVSVLLQTGKDRQAMAAVVRFTELLGKVIRIVPYLAESDPELLTRTVSDRNLSHITTELNGFLTELVTAFDAKDSVLIGDLLEYEIAPRVRELAELFAA